MNKDKRMGILIGMIFVLTGAVIIGSSIWARRSDSKLQRACSIQTVATVTDIIEQSSEDSDGDTTTYYYPVLKYAVDGESYEKKYSVSLKTQRFTIGDEVTISYNPNNPKQYYIPKYITYNIFDTIMPVFFGSLFIIAGAFVALTKKDSKKKKLEECE